MSWRKKSYEVLPALSVRGSELRRSLRLVTEAWMFGVVWVACFSGSRITVFGRMLGFSDFDFGMLAAAPFAARFTQLAAVVLIERTGLRKYQFLHCMFLSRVLWIVVAVIPLALPVPSRLAVWTMLSLIGVSWMLSAIAEPAWTTWMSDVIPRRIRGRYFASRLRYSEPIKIFVVIVLGLLLDHVTRHDGLGQVLPMTAAQQPTLLWVICVVFAVAGIAGCIDIICFRSIREVFPSTHDMPRRPALDIRVAPRGGNAPTRRLGHAARYFAALMKQVLVEPFGDRAFRRFAFYASTVAFAMTVGGSYFYLNCLENLGFGQFATDFLYLVIPAVVGLLSVKYWGRLMDRWGRRPVLLLSTACVALVVWPYFFAARHTAAPQFVFDTVNGLSELIGGWFGWGDWRWLTPDMPVGAFLWILMAVIVAGVGWSGVMLAQQGVIMGLADGKGRSKYVAALAIAVSVGGVAGGLIGGSVARALEFLQADPIVLGSLVWNNWHATFALSLLARVVALLSLIGMADPGARRLRDLARHVRGGIYSHAAALLFYPRRTLGRRLSDKRRNGNGTNSAQ